MHFYYFLFLIYNTYFLFLIYNTYSVCAKFQIDPQTKHAEKYIYCEA